MSSPSPAELLSIERAGLRALAAELSALGGELAEDAELCRSTARSFTTALGGLDDGTAEGAASAWAALDELLADSVSALAGTLTAAVDAYAARDQALAARIASGRPDGGFP
jgi:hypothetical protein